MANAEHVKILKEGVVAWNCWRVKESANLPDLRGVDLQDADLRQANLSSSDLRGAHMGGADLRGADLTESELAGADLGGAHLGGSWLRDAELSGACLREADLSFANLNGAHLREADLTGAVFSYTCLGDLDLGGCIGLEKVEHRGPSSVGVNTFFKSKGKIPESFLIGVGLPDVFLEYVASLTGNPFDFYSCFISYSHAEKSFAHRLHDSLQGKGIRCWLDEKKLLPGDHIHKEVDEALRLWDKVLLCCSKASLTSWWVDKEISKALKKEEQLWKERGKQVLAIIPLNLDGFMFDPKWDNWKKQHLTDRLAADFTGWDKDNAKFEEQLEKVVRALRGDAGARESPPKPLL